MTHESELMRLKWHNSLLLHALKSLFKQSQYNLDQSATDQGLANCRVLSEARAVLSNIEEKGA